MVRERWEQLEILYREAVEVEADRRMAFLKEACRDDAEMLQELYSLLEFKDKADDFLEGSAIDLAAKIMASEQQISSIATLMEHRGSESVDLIGMKVGNFVVRNRIGEGGMGEVYRAAHLLLKDHYVALKRVSPKFSRDEWFRGRLIQEAERAVALNHENIARIYDVVLDGDETFLVMEYIEGGSLRKRLGKPLEVDEFLSIAMQSTRALAAAHEKRIVHLDIKPENIMITPKGSVKICDFGVARQLPGLEEESTSDSKTMIPFGGTPGYMAPELLQGERWDQRADIFSMGVVFYEALTGQHPFRVDDPDATANRVLREEPISVRKQNSAVPPALESIVKRMLSKNAAGRYTNAADLLAELDAVREVIDSPVLNIWWFLPGGGGHKLAMSAVASIVMMFLIGTVSVADHPIRTKSRSLPDRRNLVVLPFHAIGEGAENQEYCEGLTEEVTLRLARLTRGRKIEIAPTSLVRDRIKTAYDAKHELDATLVLSVDLYRTKGSINAMYWLLDASTLARLREGEVSVSTDEPFLVQQKIVNGVAEMLGIALTASEVKTLASSGTHTPQAYDFYTVAMGNLREYESVEKTDNAVQLLHRALDLDPDYSLAHAGLGEAYWIKFTQFDSKSQWLDIAQTECEKSLRQDSGSTAGHICLGNVFETRGDHANALHEFDRALQTDPTNDLGLRGRGRAQEGLHDLDAAEKTFVQAIDTASHYWVGYSALVAFYVRQARYADAVKVSENIMQLEPENALVYANLGAAYIHLGLYGKAEEAFNKALSIRADYVVYSNLGMLKWRARHFPEAIPMFEHAYQLKPDYRVAGNLARAYDHVPGRKNEAKETYQHAIEMGNELLKVNPDDPDVHILLARYCAALGRRNEAIEHVRIALGQRPTSHFLQIASVVYNKLGDPAGAMGYLRNAVANGLNLSELQDEMELDNLHDTPQFRELVRIAKPSN